MPKLKNLSAPEVEAIVTAAMDVLQDIHHLADMLEKGYCDPIPRPMGKALSLSALARGAADACNKMLVAASLAEQKAELAALLNKKS